MNVTLEGTTDIHDDPYSESRVILQALRGHAVDYERRAMAHIARGYTAAGYTYLHEAAIIRSVLSREFGDGV